jgi:putative transposase
MIEPNFLLLNISRQIELLELSRSSYYYQPHVDELKEEREKQIVQLINSMYTSHPFLGSRKMQVTLREQ